MFEVTKNRELLILFPITFVLINLIIHYFGYLSTMYWPIDHNSVNALLLTL